MSQFDLLKEECVKKIQEVKKLVYELSSDLILRDINKYMEKEPDRLVKSSDGTSYIFDGKIHMRILDACLDIIDERATSYGWTFEIEFPDAFRKDEWIEHAKRIYRVSRLEETSFEGVYEVLENVKEELNQSLSILEGKNVQNFQEQYIYISDRESIECKDLEQVLETVLSRTPNFC